MTVSSSSIINNQSEMIFLPKFQIKSSWNSVTIGIFRAFYSLSLANDRDIISFFPEKHKIENKFLANPRLLDRQASNL
jgi:hypothetical protein